jgi:hypothetical protein
MKLGGDKIRSIKETYYLEEGDDSSDEELEEKIYRTATTVEYYKSIDTTIKGVKWHHYHVAKLPDNEQKTIDDFAEKLPAECFTKGKSISHGVKSKAALTKKLTPIKDSPIGKALQEAYDESKGKTISALKDSATKKALNSIIPIQFFVDEAPDVDLKWSLVCQELGTRILISDKVRELYFLNKRKIGEFNNLPSDEAIETSLKRAIKKTLKSHTKKILTDILKHKSYTSLLEELLADKRKFFSLLDENNSLYPKLKALIQEINSAAQTTQLQGIAEVPGARQIEGIIASLGNIEGFITKKTKCVSKAKTLESQVENLLSGLQYNKIYVESVKKAYKKLAEGNTLKTLIERAKKNLAAEELEEDAEIGEGLLVDLDTEIIKLKKLVARPTLDDGTSFSYKNITEVEEYPGAEVLFCHTRLIHCSTKRYAKNVELDTDFDGACFSRSWKFSTTKSLSAIESQELSSNRSLTSMVAYSHNSSYSALLTKLKDFRDEAHITDLQVVSGIKSILKSGKIPEELNINNNFERFLNILTYHLFGTEVERHPAAAIHNILALDLVSTKGLDWAFQHLPMSITDAVSVARGIQATLSKKLSIPYCYDKAHGNAKGPETEEFQSFVVIEKELISEWLKYKQFETLNDEAISAISELAVEYYDILLAGE